MSKTLYLIRGVSGAGKTTLAATLEQLIDSVSISADDYFLVDGEYQFDVNKLYEAHNYCKQTTVIRMAQCYANVIVHNTFTTEKEMKPYLNAAQEYGYKVVSLVVENRHGNPSVHDVPEVTLKRQKQRLLGSIKL